MAIYHLSMKPISRSSGRSAVAAAAYRSGTKLTNDRDGLTHDFTRKRGIEYSEIVLPGGPEAAPELNWARDRSALWNAAEFAENRKDARVAREFEVALPHELSDEQRVVLTREFAQELADRHGAAVDFAIHSPAGTPGAASTAGASSAAGDIRNHHAHIMMTTRMVGPDGLEDKTVIERENKWLLNNDMPTSHMQLKQIRQSWEQSSNMHLARAGYDIRIDHRSHIDRGLEIEPTQHMGVQATQMDRRGMEVTRQRQEQEAARRNAEIIREKPEQVLTLITGEKSVFDRHDVARTLHRYIDDADSFQNAFAKVMMSDQIVELQAVKNEGEKGEELARYSTHEMGGIEHGMAAAAKRLDEGHGFRVGANNVARALDKHNTAIRRAIATDVASKIKSGELTEQEGHDINLTAGLSGEQRNAIIHVTGAEHISVVVGYAGAGKSTMLAAAREAWEAQGYRVHGAALSGKAAEGLEESSGIASRTLASWEYGWQSGKGRLTDRDVFVIDEAGMVGSRQLAGFIGEAEKRGAKIVLVGDDEQLQAIGAGAPFRAIAERVGTASLTDIRRQRVDWQREASVDFASHRTSEALDSYDQKNAIRFGGTRDDARREIVHDYLDDREARPDGSRVALAHRRIDVRAINEDIRIARQERGDLAQGKDAGEIVYQTNDGQRAFAPGDRIVFLENDRDLGVKNGMLGTVLEVEEGRIKTRLDGRDQDLIVSTDKYQAIDHGYATTIHKSQGATVDRAFVMASSTMDRHLTYVSMTRHRDDVTLYASQDEFTSKDAGTLVAHGSAPYENNPANKDSYFVTLKSESGRDRTIWGVDLSRAIGEAGSEVGDKISLKQLGSETVRLPDGQVVERNLWKVQSSEDMAFVNLKERLGRSGAKETTLDYVPKFAAHRGIGDGSDQDIVLERAFEPALGLGREDQTDDIPSPHMIGGTRSSGSDLDQVGESPLPDVLASESIKPKRGMFDGLKLSAKSQPEFKPKSKLKSKSNDRSVPEPQTRLEDLLKPQSEFERALGQYAQIHSDSEDQKNDGLPVSIGQKRELQKLGDQLDKARPNSTELLNSAFKYDAVLLNAVKEKSGRERVATLVKAIDIEEKLQSDPHVRADRTINHWRELKQDHDKLPSWGRKQERAQIENDMQKVADRVRKDPDMEIVMRPRAKELGISNLRQGQDLDKAMVKSLSRGLER